MPYVPVQVTDGALVAHRNSVYFILRLLSAVPRRTAGLLFSSHVSLRNDLADPVFDSVGLAGLRAGPMLFYWHKLLAPFSPSTVFHFSSFFL